MTPEEKKIYQREAIRKRRQSQEYKDREKAYRKEYNSRPEIIIKNREREKKRKRAYNSSDKRKEYLRQWRARPEVAKKRKERYKNKVKTEEQRRKERERNIRHKSRPEVKEKRKIQRASLQNKITSHQYCHLRRVRYAQTDITKEWLMELWRNTEVCVVCGSILDASGKYPRGKHLDHIVPINVGGLHMMNNVRYICAQCNLERPKDGSDVISNQGVQ